MSCKHEKQYFSLNYASYYPPKIDPRLIFLSQENHEHLAERKGLHVVEFRPENSMRPLVVSSPSAQAAKEAEKKRTMEDKDYNFDEIFDPYKGVHRPRKVKLWKLRANIRAFVAIVIFSSLRGMFRFAFCSHDLKCWQQPLLV